MKIFSEPLINNLLKFVVFFTLTFLFILNLKALGNPTLKSLGPERHPLSSNTHHEGPMGFTEDGQLLFWQASKDYSENTAFLASNLEGQWEAKAPAFAFPGYETGYAPIPGGFFFSSSADTGQEDLPDHWNIWRALDQGDMRKAEPLSPPLNTKKSECCLVSGPHNKFYFSSDREGSWDIYEAELKGVELENIKRLDQPNSDEFGEWPSFIDPDGKFMLFSSIRKSGFGGDDIYISFSHNGNWSAPAILPAPINTETYEDSGMISPDGKTFYWSSRFATDFSKEVGNIYFISITGTILESIFKGESMDQVARD